MANLNLRISVLIGHNKPSISAVLWRGTLSDWLDTNAEQLGWVWSDIRAAAELLANGGVVRIGGGAEFACTLIATAPDSGTAAWARLADV